MRNTASFFLIIGLLVVFDCKAQLFKKKYKTVTHGNNGVAGDPFPDPMRYEQKGWCFAPGITYMFPQSFGVFGNENDSLKPAGGFRLYAEFGRFKIFEYSQLFKYMDYGLAFKMLSGSEDVYSTNFSSWYATAHFNLNNVIKINNKSFISNTVGANLDYAVIKFGDGSTPPSLVGQLHYKFGVGFRVSDKLMVIPAIETPILNANPFENGRSTLGFLNARYRPLILSIRFLLLKPKKDICPPVYTPDFPDGHIPDGMEH